MPRPRRDDVGVWLTRAAMITLEPTGTYRLRSHHTSHLSPVQSLRLHDIIIAPATPTGPGARAILRMTGDGAFQLLSSLLASSVKRLTALKPGRYDAQVRLPDFYSLLPVHLQLWAAPKTYTGQDLVEIHLISSPPLVQALLDHLLECGARMAQPGEFTLRAFLAGKLDLTQAEAVLALTTSQDTEELRIALAQLAGGLARPLDQLREELLVLLAEVEAGLDFAEEDLTLISQETLAERLESASDALLNVRHHLLDRGQTRSALRVALVGPPNAGKSSLFNTLLGKSVALVSPEAGTTRDYLTGELLIQGVVIELTDTAGRDTARDVIGTQAQANRRQQLIHADLALFCFEANQGLSPEDEAILHSLPAQRVMQVATKSDQLDAAFSHPNAILTSTLTGAGLATLRFSLAERARAALRPAILAPSLSRCQGHIDRALERLDQAHEWTQRGQRMELVAAELRSALDEVGAMVGAVYTDDLLDRVFSQFCIGK